MFVHMMYIDMPGELKKKIIAIKLMQKKSFIFVYVIAFF